MRTIYIVLCILIALMLASTITFFEIDSIIFNEATIYLNGIYNVNITDNNADKKDNDTRPNIIFILSDDFGWNDIGYNNHVKDITPNLDYLANYLIMII